MTISLTWVDAFTDRPFAGNPAGVCLLEEPLADSTMQSLAAELGIAETAFVTPADHAAPSGCAGSPPWSRSTCAVTPRWPRPTRCGPTGWSTAPPPVTFHTRSGPLVAASRATSSNSTSRPTR